MRWIIVLAVLLTGCASDPKSVSDSTDVSAPWVVVDTKLNLWTACDHGNRLYWEAGDLKNVVPADPTCRDQ